MNPLFAVEVPDFLLTPLKIFALIGCATAGGWVLGWVASVMARLYFAQKIPPWPMWFIRTLGFMACGLLAYLWLFGGGGGGIGWGGGGGGPKDGVVPKKDESIRKDRDKEKGGKDDKEKITPEQTLRVEVLGNATLKRLSKSPEFDDARRYRILPAADLLTLAELKERIQIRCKSSPPLSVLEIVLYNDSPDESVPLVRDLTRWARDQSVGKDRLKVNTLKLGSPAPLN